MSTDVSLAPGDWSGMLGRAKVQEGTRSAHLKLSLNEERGAGSQSGVLGSRREDGCS